ncbi:MAG: hypothetical protein H7Y18_00600 [Clostridiaceae bacterium]|nr:hypothetical protein [Clostridiaceae bacterium]
MKSKKIAIALTLTLLLGVGGTVLAAETTTNTKNNIATHQALEMKRMVGIRGYDSVISVLKNKLGLTDKEITDKLTLGKTVYDLAKEKGMTQEQFQTALLEERSKAIDEAVTKGTITKEHGDTLKETLKTNQASCTGNFCEGNTNSHGNIGGMMGNGRGMMRNFK